MHDFNNYLPYTNQDILKAIHGIGCNRVIKFRYDILNQYNEKIKELKDVASAEISCENQNSIKKTLKLSYRNNEGSFIFNKVKPIVSFLMPDGNFLDFGQGIFVIANANKQEHLNSLYIDSNFVDELKIIDNEKTDYRLCIKAGTSYIDAIKQLLNRLNIFELGTAGRYRGYYKIENTSDALAVDREWEIGKSYLEIINDLLKDMAYTTLYSDYLGVFRAKKNKTIDELPIEYDYADDQQSIQFNGVGIESDYFEIPNKFTLVVSNPELPPMKATYSNAADIAIRGQTINKIEMLDYISSQSALEDKVKLIAEQYGKITEKISFEAAINPLHDVFDVYRVINKTHGVNEIYKANSWSYILKAGERMKHIAIRKVAI